VLELRRFLKPHLITSHDKRMRSSMEFMIRWTDDDGDDYERGPFSSQSAAEDEYETLSEAIAEENETYSLVLLSRDLSDDTEDGIIRWEVIQGIIVESEEDEESDDDDDE
jgi:hypothetical protein